MPDLSRMRSEIKALALLSMREFGQAALQHWAGVYCFAAGFRRPLFCIMREIFHAITDYEDTVHDKCELSLEVSEELLLGALLLPLAWCGLYRSLVPGSDGTPFRLCRCRCLLSPVRPNA